MKTKRRIINRTEPCKCGCKGRDPWHAKTFTRVVEVDTTDPTKGRANLPWGKQDLHRIDYGKTYGAWKVQR